MKQIMRVNPKRQGKGMNKTNENCNNDAEWLRREETCKYAWLIFFATNEMPNDIPARPDVVYANEGWRGWQDWLGLTDSKGNGGQQ